MATYRLPFEDDHNWGGSHWNWDDPMGGHGDHQAYAFDIGHPLNGVVRAAREGVVVYAVHDVDCNTYNLTDQTDPCYGAPGGGNTVFIEHPDGTVALYAHFMKDKVFVSKGQWVPQGKIIGLSGNTGNSGGPHLHFDVRAYGTGIAEEGPTIPVQFEDKNHTAWRPKAGDTLASNNTVFRQEQWRWCHKCQGLFYGGASPIAGTGGGTCPADGHHEAVGSGNYMLIFDSTAPGQADWRWCSNCQGLFFGGNPGSRCPFGGAHSKAKSGNYVLVHNDPSAPGQANWRWCQKCQGLFFAGNPGGSLCPAGGAHSTAGSGNYTLVQMGPGAAQRHWRWCNKCQGLFFDGNPGSKCPAGGGHTPGASGDYVLVYDYVGGNAPGQSDWRWCSKCQGLFFGGNPGSKCPAGGEHSKAGSGNYTLVPDAPAAPGQADWRWCNKCQGLFFGGNPGSKCPAGGAHTAGSTGSYSLVS